MKKYAVKILMVNGEEFYFETNNIDLFEQTISIYEFVTIPIEDYFNEQKTVKINPKYIASYTIKRIKEHE